MGEEPAASPGAATPRAALLRARLPGACARGEFEVEYQPICDLRSGRALGFEALLRWRDAGALVPPDEFIPLAEESGDIAALSDWMVARACRDLAALGAACGVSLNVSSGQLVEPGFAARFVERLRAAGVDPARVSVEVTESVLIREPGQAIAALAHLRGAGVRVAIDDFGTGFSSLAYLRELPCDVVKVDRSFVAGATQDAVSQAILEAIAQIGRRIGVAVLAEGVETQDQRDWLAQAGFALGQGYLFGRPAPADHWSGRSADAAIASGPAAE